jgi:multiple RNA-binding domain-containing protein 1
LILNFQITEQKIREVFGQKGVITDVQLKHKDGRFRQFGFVGFEKDESAAEAVKYFNQTFINTSRISVEICAALGDESKPKAWSKHAKDSRLKKKEPEEPESELPVEKKEKKNKIEEIIGEHKNDPDFIEFMKVHNKDKPIWDNDLQNEVEQEDEGSEKSDQVESEKEEEKLANKEDITDADYMKFLMKPPEEQKKVQTKKEKSKKAKEMVKLFTVKIRNVPKKIKREDLIKFFRPAKAFSVRIPTGGVDCYAYVGFKNERDLNRALLKDKSFLSEFFLPNFLSYFILTF